MFRSQSLTPGARLFAAAAASLVLAGCAFWYRAGVWSEIMDVHAAFDAAAAERAQLCTDTPDACRRRLRLAPDKSPDDPGAWSYEIAPSYRAEHEIDLARLRRAVKRTWLGLEYANAIAGALADRTDAGEIAERDAWVVLRKAREQSRQMMIAQIDAERSALGPEEWRATSLVLLERAVAELNAYTAATTGFAAIDDAESAPTGCTAGVRALGGRRLCATDDGRLAPH